ncbi:MAG: aminotransferase class I/II-fold pyridoxal phosphate-dependent enzyme [Halanaerobiales bacterium]
MKFDEFKLERYFSRYEFNTEYLLSSSDCETISRENLLAMADEKGKKKWKKLKLGYTETKGDYSLREEIAKLYQNIDPEDVIVLAPAEGIFITLNTLLEEGDHVIVMFPAYQSLYEIPQGLNCEVTRWPVKLREDGWSLDLDFLEEEIKDTTKMVVTNFPHNPTGFLPDSKDYQRLMDIVKENDLYLFSDEMYKFSEYDADDRLLSPGDTYYNGISLSGLSKSFGLPGLRIGWLFSKNREILDEIIKFKDYTTICSSAPSEVLAYIALRSKEKILTRNMEIIKDNLKAARKFFADYNEIFNWIEPQAGPIAFPELQADLTVNRFCQDIVKKKNVMLLPGNVFEVKGNYFRLGLGRKNFKEGLQRVREYVEERFSI